jgi:AraC-like DNA-binding protein
MIYTSILVTLVICLMLILYHWKENKPIILFIYFFLTIGQRSLIYLLLESGSDPTLLGYLFIHNIPFSLLMGPALYYYTLSVIHGKFHLNKWIWIAIIPSIIAFISLEPYFEIPISDKIQFFAKSNTYEIDSDFFKHASRWIPIRVFQNAMLFINSTYYYYCIYLLIKARKQANKVIKKRINNILGILGVITILTYLPAVLIYFFIYSNSNFFMNGIITMNYFPPLRFLSLFTTLTPFLILLFPNWLYANQINANQQSKWDLFLMKWLDKPLIETEKTESNTTDDDDLERIMEYLKTDKQYLNPNLSIHEISKSLDIPQARVTYCFNKVIKVPFPRLRNQLRIEHAIELLTQNAHLSLSIEGIAMQAGFKNKSTFYIAFKDVKGMTPMDWINKREI